jgi:hypothetical protein
VVVWRSEGQDGSQSGVPAALRRRRRTSPPGQPQPGRLRRHPDLR